MVGIFTIGEIIGECFKKEVKLNRGDPRHVT
jgi:hypothetical protein